MICYNISKLLDISLELTLMVPFDNKIIKKI